MWECWGSSKAQIIQVTWFQSCVHFHHHTHHTAFSRRQLENEVATPRKSAFELGYSTISLVTCYTDFYLWWIAAVNDNVTNTIFFNFHVNFEAIPLKFLKHSRRRRRRTNLYNLSVLCWLLLQTSASRYVYFWLYQEVMLPNYDCPRNCVIHQSYIASRVTHCQGKNDCVMMSNEITKALALSLQAWMPSWITI